MKTLRKTKQTTQLALAAVILLAIRFALVRIGELVRTIDGAPAWLGPVLQIAGLAAGIIALAPLVYLIYAGLRWLYHTLMDVIEEQPEQEPEEEQRQSQARAITRNLHQTVRRLDQHGSHSQELVTQAAAETEALIAICMKLQRRASTQARLSTSLQFALDAIAQQNAFAVKQAAGSVRDKHIARLMTLANADATPAYWDAVGGLVATQLGAAQRWQEDYERMATSLIAEVSSIKLRLTDMAAAIEVTEVARPLLAATTNLETAGRLLGAPIVADTDPTRLFQPINEYALPEGSH